MAAIFSLFAAALLASGCAMARDAGAHAARSPGLLTQLSTRHPFAVRPPVVVYTGDGSGVLGGFDGDGTAHHLGHLSWSKWTAGEARGSGAVWLDDCQPNCAEGSFFPYHVKVHAFRPRSGHFTRLTLRYRYHGKALVDERGVRHYGADPSGYWEYYIVAWR